MPQYIVAGDEMLKIMNRLYPENEAIPFREDLSKGRIEGNMPDSEFISKRARFWGVGESEYREKFKCIINLDLSKEYVLCFGEDDCCRANLAFIIGYLKSSGYAKPVRVRIVNEITLELIREYIA